MGDLLPARRQLLPGYALQKLTPRLGVEGGWLLHKPALILY
jgi:hypothetical protein